MLVEQPGEDEVVDVALVARAEHDGRLGGGALQPREPLLVHLDARVEPPEEPGEERPRELHEGRLVAARHLAQVLLGLGGDRRGRAARRARHRLEGRAQRPIAQHLLADARGRLQGRADDGAELAGEVAVQDAAHLAPDGGVGLPGALGQHGLEVEGAAHVEDGAPEVAEEGDGVGGGAAAPPASRRGRPTARASASGRGGSRRGGPARGTGAGRGRAGGGPARRTDRARSAAPGTRASTPRSPPRPRRPGGCGARGRASRTARGSPGRPGGAAARSA